MILGLRDLGTKGFIYLEIQEFIDLGILGLGDLVIKGFRYLEIFRAIYRIIELGIQRLRN